MSRLRTKAKVRGNTDYIAATEELTRLDIPWRLEPPTGKGHPMLHITLPAGVYRRPVGCSPSTRTPKGAYVNSLHRWLRERGVGV